MDRRRRQEEEVRDRGRILPGRIAEHILAEVQQRKKVVALRAGAVYFAAQQREDVIIVQADAAPNGLRAMAYEAAKAAARHAEGAHALTGGAPPALQVRGHVCHLPGPLRDR